LRGGTGDAQAFKLTTDPALSAFAYDPAIAVGMTRSQIAQDAILKLDGVEVRRTKNTVDDLIDGVSLTLIKENPGINVALAAKRPTEALKQAVNDFVTAYNQLETIFDGATAPAGSDGTGGGPLRTDTSIRDLRRKLGALTSSALAKQTGPSTLAEIGVRTNRDGSLTVDSSRLDAALTDNPDAVEALFNPGQHSDNNFVAISSALGKTKPGNYALSNLVPATSGVDPSGLIDGVAAIASGTQLIAASGSAAQGLILNVSGAVSSASITVDLGLGGALQAIRDAVKDANGGIASAQKRLGDEAGLISKDRVILEARDLAYRAQLTQSFSTMDALVSASRATQSFLEQQIKVWTKSS
jgi:flagellar hook-associated protein 2